MLTGEIAEENGRYRWRVLKDGKDFLTGTRKTKEWAEQEVKSQIKFHERQAQRDRA